MKCFKFLPLIASMCFVAACQTPNQPNSVPLKQVQAQLPTDWIDVPASDYRLAFLDSATRRSLVDFRGALATERASDSYRFNGGYSDATWTKWRALNDSCDKSYCANAMTIAKNLTPELAGTSLSVNEAYMNSAVVGDVDLRQVQDDWARFWLMNKPSMLSPYPIVNTGGRP
ncbi:MAG: hypothetical protein EXS15_08095 [Phycisphaerales bacterium]|nr:hypothetical protein [Phycisphaerales bacterium]